MRYSSIFILAWFLLTGCSKERRYLNQHSVILASHFIDGQEVLTDKAKKFEEKHSIKFREAYRIYMHITSKNSKEPRKAADTVISYPTVIIDDYYVYSFTNLKTDKVAVFGIGINADTGETKNFTETIWIYEKDIPK